ncbi:hypothetical protein EG832_11620 [bacterium]|nr:hypothetical protein [bacterium]
MNVETQLVVVSNTTSFGKKQLIDPGASMRDGLLDIFVYPELSKDELISYYTGVREDDASAGEKGQHYQARRVEVRTAPKMKVMADGMAMGKDAVAIKVLPGALRVICPKIATTPQSVQEEFNEILPEPDFTPEKVSDVEESVI